MNGTKQPNEQNMCYKMMKNDVNGKTNSKKNNPDICLDGIKKMENKIKKRFRNHAYFVPSVILKYFPLSMSKAPQDILLEFLQL